MASTPHPTLSKEKKRRRAFWRLDLVKWTLDAVWWGLVFMRCNDSVMHSSKSKCTDPSRLVGQSLHTSHKIALMQLSRWRWDCKHCLVQCTKEMSTTTQSAERCRLTLQWAGSTCNAPHFRCITIKNIAMLWMQHWDRGCTSWNRNCLNSFCLTGIAWPKWATK